MRKGFGETRNPIRVSRKVDVDLRKALHGDQDAVASFLYLVCCFRRPLWKYQNSPDDQYQEDRGCHIAAEVEPAGVVGFVEKVTDNGSERSR